MPRRSLLIIGCIIASVLLIALCCGASIFLYNNFYEFLNPLVPPVTQTLTPLATSTAVSEFVTPESPTATSTLEDATSQPDARATLSPRIPFPTPYSVPTIYPVALSESYDVEPYSVSGNTPQQIRLDLNTKGVIDPNSGQRFDSETRWRLDGHWNWQPTARGCEVRDATLTLQITLTIPTLTVTDNTADDLLSGWNHYIERLKIHEGGHIDMDVSQARQLRDDFANFPPAFNCTLLSAQLQTRFDKAIDAIKSENLQYDDDTNHGATQGAVFP